MSPSSLPLILALSFVWCHCASCQDPEQIPLSSIDTLNSGVANVSQILEGMMTEMNTKLLKMNTRMNAMKTKMEELQETQTEKLADIQTKLETLEDVQTMMGILEERDRLRDSSNQTCRSDQIEALQDALVAHSSNQTSSDRVEILQESFTAEFQTMNKLVENCPSLEMMKIIRQDLETAMICALPSMFIPSLGCITPVRRSGTWNEAKDHCQQNGARLLEGIRSHKELHQLKHYFENFGGADNAWLGIKNGEWIGGGDSLRKSSLWTDVKPGLGDERCGYVNLSPSNPVLGDSVCYSDYNAFCQAGAPEV